MFTHSLEIDSEVIPVGQILLEDDSNSGFKNDFITNDTTPTLYGYTEGDATVVLSVEDAGGNVTVVATVTADGSGYWSVDVPAGILTTDGNYTFTADITDEAGNEATTSQVLTIDTDLAAPTITMDVDSFGSFNGTDTDFITDDTTPEFTITTEVDTKLEIYRDDVLVHTVAIVDNDGNGVLSFSETGLTAGEYTYRFVSSDSAGNTSETTQVVEIDPTYEAADLTVALDSDYDTGISDADGLTNEPRPVFSGTAEAGSKVRVYFSGPVRHQGRGPGFGSGRRLQDRADPGRRRHDLGLHPQRPGRRRVRRRLLQDHGGLPGRGWQRADHDHDHGAGHHAARAHAHLRADRGRRQHHRLRDPRPRTTRPPLPESRNRAARSP